MLEVKSIVYDAVGIVFGNSDVMVGIITFTLFAAFLLTIIELFTYYKGV